jgi:lysophospholipase L1-like esterase
LGEDSTVGGYLQALLGTEPDANGTLYRVWTFANPAWSTTHERIAIENRLSELEPDLVISLSGNNDVHWGLLGRNVLWSRIYQQQTYWSVLDTAHRAGGRGPFVDVTEVTSDPVAPDVVARRLGNNVRMAAFALSLDGVPYVFALQPTLAVSKKGLSNRERFLTNEHRQYFVESYAAIDARLRGLEPDGFHYIDLSGAVDEYRNKDELFIDSFHFGDRGYEIIAGKLLTALRTKGFELGEAE